MMKNDDKNNKNRTLNEWCAVSMRDITMFLPSTSCLTCILSFPMLIPIKISLYLLFILRTNEKCTYMGVSEEHNKHV